MAACEDNAIGFVSWGETKTRYQSSCWMIGISLAPQARGHGYGTEATRQLARYDDVLYSLLRHEVDLR